jgi:amino-acid N-acetyltransferase
MKDRGALVRLRKAGIRDASAIHKLVNAFAARDLMMPRALNEIFENIRDFWVATDRQGRLVGCVALHIVGWDNLAEIKSLAVEKKRQGRGVGRLLIEACLTEAVSLQVGAIFALSYVPKFFKKFGFRVVAKSRLPHKIWAECCHCPKFPDCGEIALLKKI